MDRTTRALALILGLLPGVAAAQAQAQDAGTQAPAAPQSTAPSPPPPATQEVIYQGEATGILGRQVNGPDRAAVGRIVDVLVDEAGQPRAVVVELGGFMGVGSRRIAVAWRALRFAPGAAGRDAVTLEMTADQVRETPEYKPASRPVTVAAPPAPQAAAPAQPEAPPSDKP